ncbi:MAG: cupin domain-containing protein [Gammaproteobacteria bacterium]|nr:cupin domain-containing protein [Gammaproteobacteria bacterium]
MTGYIDNIEKLTLTNQNFRKVLFTTKQIQLVVMTLKPNEDVGMEIHPENDQFFRIEKGEGKVIMNKKEHIIKEDDVIIIPAGTEHNVINTSSTEPLQFYTIYAPPHHKDGTMHKTKAEAIEDEEDHL